MELVGLNVGDADVGRSVGDLVGAAVGDAVGSGVSSPSV